MIHSFRKALAAAAAVAVLASCATPNPVLDAEMKFKASFKNMPVDSVSTSEVPGVFEVYSQGKLFYFAPAQQVLMFGEFYTTTGESLTQKKIASYQRNRVLEIPADIGVSVGSGGTEIVAFLDPDCGHCRQAHDWLEAREFKDVRVRTIFLPIDTNNPSYARAIQFVCAPPELRREALNQVYEHATPAPGQHYLTCDGAAAQLQAQADIAKKLGVEGTPTFVLKGQTVLGFDQARLETLLSSTNAGMPLAN